MPQTIGEDSFTHIIGFSFKKYWCNLRHYSQDIKKGCLDFFFSFGPKFLFDMQNKYLLRVV